MSRFSFNAASKKLLLLLAAALMLGGMGFYCVRSAERVSGLYSELSQQRRLREIKEGYLSSMDANRKLTEEFKRPKVMAADDMSEAVVNLGAQLAKAGLTETYYKLEQRETLRETDRTASICRLAIEGTGSYEHALDFLNAVAAGDFYYFMENVKITADDAGVRLRAAYVITGISGPGAAEPAIPEEYLFRDPFGGSDAKRQ